jgi:hypothetical protein
MHLLKYMAVLKPMQIELLETLTPNALRFQARLLLTKYW